MNAKVLQNCPICSKNSFEKAKIIPYPVSGPERSGIEPTHIIFCDNCGIGIAIPSCTREDLDTYYSEGSYWTKHSVEILSARRYPVPYALAASRWDLLEPLITGTDRKISILDIGSGHGFFGMIAARSKTIQLGKYTCVEKDNVLTKSLQKTWSINFKKISLEIHDRIDNVTGDYDLVILSHILEHLPDPKSFLRNASEKLSKDGILFVDVPNQDHLFKNNVFPHLLFFNTSSLIQLIQECGLTVRYIDCYGNDMNTSTLNYRNVAKWKGLLPRIIMKTKQLLPEKLLVKYYSEHYDMGKKHGNGIWIRGIGKHNWNG